MYRRLELGFGISQQSQEFVGGKQACGAKGWRVERATRACLLAPPLCLPHRHALVADALKRVPTHVHRSLAYKEFRHPAGSDIWREGLSF